MTTSVLIIAEAGVNHNGSLDMAKKLVDAATSAGADIVKFQTFKAEKLVSMDALKADYQLRSTSESESQFEMLKRLELSEDAHREIVAHCKDRRIQFLSTPFDEGSLKLLMQFNLPRLKLSSSEVTNAPFLLLAARTGKSIILSTGMSTLAEVETALSVFAFGYLRPHDEIPTLQTLQAAYMDPRARQILQSKVTLLQCTTEYPAPFSDVNLRAMSTLAQAFGLSVGFSDHTTGIATPIAAVALGAAVIEKHFTLDRRLPGPDHRASLEPDEFATMARSIREVEQSLGDQLKIPAASELKNRTIARKSLVAQRAIKAGELFTEDNLGIKRPGTGLSPIYYWDWLGKTAPRDYRKDEVI